LVTEVIRRSIHSSTTAQVTKNCNSYKITGTADGTEAGAK
jgi:hypothetical protein